MLQEHQRCKGTALNNLMLPVAGLLNLHVLLQWQVLQEQCKAAGIEDFITKV